MNLKIKNQKIIIATGGTGGHIFPARVLAEELSEDNDVKILANSNYRKYNFIADNFSYNIILSSSIKKSFLGLLSFVGKISFGILQSFFIILFFQPNVVISFGSYATFPTLFAALLLRKKIILHEQNAHLGKVNNLFSKFADKILLTYKNTSGIKPKLKKKTIITGNPIRKEIVKLSKTKYQLPIIEKFDNSDRNMGYNLLLASDFKSEIRKIDSFFNILIIGGSGGAEIFSNIMPKAIFNLRSNIKEDILIHQQCKKNLVNITAEQYKSFKINSITAEFFTDMTEKIKNAHLIISRAGSSAIGEFNIAKKPLILIPLANSTDNHQLKNAKEIAKKDGAIIIEEKDFTINKISNLIAQLIDNPEILLEMSNKSYKTANKNSTTKVIKAMSDLLHT